MKTNPEITRVTHWKQTMRLPFHAVVLFLYFYHVHVRISAGALIDPY